MDQATQLASVVGQTVSSATSAFKRSLIQNAGPAGLQDPAACASAAAVWREAIAGAKRVVEPEFATGEAPLFVRHLLALTSLAYLGGWALLTLTTGRTMESGVESSAEAGINDDMDAQSAMARINSASGKRQPPCTRMQAQWALAFWSLVGAGTYSGTLVFHTLWDYAYIGGAVEKAARPFALRFRCGNLTQSAVDPAVYFYGGATSDVGKWAVDESDGLPTWREGDTCAGVRALQLSSGCAGAIQPYLAGLLDMPPVLTLPVTRILPLPQPLVTWLMPSAAAQPLTHHGSSGGSSDVIDDELTLADPFAGTKLAGWFDGSHFVVPGPQGLVYAVLDVLFVLTFSYVATLFAREYWSQNAPKWRRRWMREHGPLKKGGSGAGKPKAHRE